MELFESDDYFWLGLDDHYMHWSSGATIEMANGNVWRNTFMLEIQLSVNGESFGPIIRTEAFISPGLGEDSPRCSGMFLRQNLFTATSPFANGDLLISDRKSGVTKDLKAN